VKLADLPGNRMADCANRGEWTNRGNRFKPLPTHAARRVSIRRRASVAAARAVGRIGSAAATRWRFVYRPPQRAIAAKPLAKIMAGCRLENDKATPNSSRAPGPSANQKNAAADDVDPLNPTHTRPSNRRLQPSNPCLRAQQRRQRPASGHRPQASPHRLRKQITATQPDPTSTGSIKNQRRNNTRSGCGGSIRNGNTPPALGRETAGGSKSAPTRAYLGEATLGPQINSRPNALFERQIPRLS